MHRPEHQPGEIFRAVSVAGSSGDQDSLPCTDSDPDAGVLSSFHGGHDLCQGEGLDLDLSEEGILPGMEVDARTIGPLCDALLTLGSEPFDALLPFLEQGPSQHNGMDNSGSAGPLPLQQQTSPYTIQGVAPPANTYPTWGYDQYSFNYGTNLNPSPSQYPNVGSSNFNNNSQHGAF
ncbi:hypothetical protein AX15_004446 [Amanita polypyramis BW_CC]|nr:hypothetical protein AX15_004446 [Amanita polypyramis BW_CC]